MGEDEFDNEEPKTCTIENDLERLEYRYRKVVNEKDRIIQELKYENKRLYALVEKYSKFVDNVPKAVGDVLNAS